MKKVAPTSEKTQGHYDGLVEALRPHAVVASAMFGMPTLKVNGKAFVGVCGDDLVFKLTGGDHARALALKGAVLFDPSGTGRPMKEWVVVPKAHAKTWGGFAEASAAFVASASALKKPASKAKRTSTKRA